MLSITENIALTFQIADSSLTPAQAWEKAEKNLAIPLPDDLTWGTFITHRRNEFGVPESVLWCPTCEAVYTVTPAITDNTPEDQGCLAPECASYDINRDVSAILGLGESTLHNEREAGLT